VYIPTRYPTDGYIKASREEAKHCLEIAEKIIDFIKDKIDLSIYYQ
ncbi:HEPN domain-containing protein, partial [bacterium]|nr:HEPN domain-containing protein [bacterium]